MIDTSASADSFAGRVSMSSHEEPKLKCAFEIKQPSQYRRNVLDLIELFGGKAQKAHLICDVDMSIVESLRVEYSASDHHVTVTSFLLKAISLAQESHPDSRTLRLPFGRSVTLERIVAGFTAERIVDGDPIVFFGEIEQPCQKSLLEIADELKQYSETAIEKVEILSKQKRFAEMPWLLRRIIIGLGIWFPAVRLLCNSATFGLSSLGALGVKTVIGPSVCTSVFGVGAVEPCPVVRDGQIVIRSIMSLSLNYDQNVMDGGQAARFLQDVRVLLENGLVDYDGVRP